jgi:hypothetical protein
VLLGLFGSLWQTPAGALSSLIGFTLLLTGLMRWSRRARRPVAASVDTPRATASL